MALRTAFFTAAAWALLVAAPTLAADDYVILEVGEREIRKSEVQAVWDGLFPEGQAPDFDTVEEPIKQNVLRGTVSEYLLYDEALEADIDEQEAVQRRIEEARRKLIVRAFIDHKGETLISEDDVKAEYDRIVRETRGKEEIRARHILVDSEETVKKIAQELEEGGDFEALAKEYSADPGSREQGGDLGYFSEGQMVPEFEKAAFALKKGEVSEPVESSFGWHVIKLVDRRDLKAPTFTELRETIRKKLMEERLNEYVNKLLDSTPINYYGPDGEKKELTKMPDSTKDGEAGGEGEGEAADE